ncbi:MAG TPA: DUF1361 domain-containing protein [Tepidisphaeraceae bacterium]|nr:DUF1361 domain-containing protein [Tepidisphaeraceae bacterium]
METVPSLRQSLSYRHRLLLIAVLVLSSLAALGLQEIRQGWTNGTGRFWYIAWDVFLAWVPLAFAAALYHAHERGSKNWPYMLLLGALWLLFFPNAPYLLTEFVHLGGHPGGPVPLTHVRDAIWWCDLIVILSIAWVGLLLGFVSMYLVQRVVEERSNAFMGWVVVLACLSAGSFGMTLGRVQRLNSWTMITDPRVLVRSLRQLSDDQWMFHHAIALSGLLAAFLILAYLALIALMAMGRDEDALRRTKISVLSFQFSEKKEPRLDSSLKTET